MMRVDDLIRAVREAATIGEVVAAFRVDGKSKSIKPAANAAVKPWYSSFKEWFDDADMPEQMEDGTWVDLETGLPYIPVGAGGDGKDPDASNATWAERQRKDDRMPLTGPFAALTRQSASRSGS